MTPHVLKGIPQNLNFTFRFRFFAHGNQLRARDREYYMAAIGSY